MKDQAETPPPFGGVVACIDESAATDRVVTHAAAVAGALMAPLTLLRVIERPPHGVALLDPLEWEMRRKEARAAIERLTEAVPHADELSVDAEIVEGAAAEQICFWAGRHDQVALTVFGTHGVHGRTTWSLASTARRLLDKVPGSVLLVPTTGAAPTGRYRSVLVPLDGSPRAESVLPLACRIAAAHGAKLVLAHVVPVPELTEIRPLDSEDVELRTRLIRRNERVARAYLDRLRARLDDQGLTLGTVVVGEGDVRSRLSRFIAKEGIDLVVLSAHGRTGRSDVPFGTVAGHLVARAAVPLLVVRPRPAVAMRRVTASLSQPARRLPSEAVS